MVCAVRSTASWLRRSGEWLGLTASPGARAARRPKPLPPRPALELLEDRCLPSTLQAISLPPANQPPSNTAAGASDSPSVSANGQYVAFESKASNLVPGQTGTVDVLNVYLRDTVHNTTILVSHVPGNATEPPPSALPSYSPIISANGRYVLFGTEAPELAPGLMTFDSAVMLYDVQNGTLTTVSQSLDSHCDPDAISSDGSYILFVSDGTDLISGETSGANPGTQQLYLYQPGAAPGQRTQLVSHAAGQPLTPGDFGIDAAHIGETGRVDFAKVGDATVADNGLVAYVDRADNLISPSPGPFQVYLYNPNTQTNRLISFAANNPTAGTFGSGQAAVISRTGTAVAYVSQDVAELVGAGGQNNPQNDNVFLYNIASGQNTLLTRSTKSTPGDVFGGDGESGAAGMSLAVSADGQTVAFSSDADDLVPNQSGAADNVFLYSSASQSLILVSGAGGSATVGAGGVPDLNPNQPTGVADPITGAALFGGPEILSMSDDGTRVAYVSSAGDVVAGQTGAVGADNVFVYSASTHKSALATGVGGSATAADAAESSFPVLSDDGSLLVFHSLATDLIPSPFFDGNGGANVFTYNTASPGVVGLASPAAFHPSQPGSSYSTSVSADGRYTVFLSNATNLVLNQATVNSEQNVFLYDNQTKTITLVNHVPGAPNTTGDGGVHPFFAPTSGDAAAPPQPWVQPVISADGSTIAFTSFDDNLVPGEVIPQSELDQSSEPGPVQQFIYLYHVTGPQPGTITLVNHASGATATVQAPALNGVFYDSFQPVISFNGQYVAFAFGKPGNDGVGVELYNQTADASGMGPPMLIDSNASDASLPVVAWSPSISDDGRFVAYVKQGNVYVYDRQSMQITLVSHDVNSTGTPASGTSSQPVVSHDGTVIAFTSTAPDLVSNQGGPANVSNIFLYNLTSKQNILVSGADGSASVGADGNSDSPAVSNNVSPASGGAGYSVAFRSDANNLLAGQSGPTGNIFEFTTLPTNSLTLVSHQAGSPTVGAGGSSTPVIDDDGHLVSYVSTAGDLIPNQTGTIGVQNVFVWLRQTGANILASGQNGSPTVGGNQDSELPLITRHSDPFFSSTATNLINGIGGYSVAYLNTLVSLALSPNTVADGSPGGAAVGGLTITSLLAGSYIPPVFTPLDAQGDDADFALAPTPGGETLFTAAGFTAAFAVRSSYAVNVTVDVGFGPSVFALPVFVAPPPTLGVGPAALPPPQVGVPYSQTLTATGGQGPYTFSVYSGQLPAGLSLSPNGVLGGTPTAGGPFAFTVVAADSRATPTTGNLTYSFAVAAPTIVANAAALPVAQAGAAYSQTLPVSGGTAPYFVELTAGALPAGMKLSSAGVLSGTPTAAGPAAFTVVAIDASTGQGAPYAAALSYTLNVDTAGVSLGPAGLPQARVGSAYSQALAVSGGQGPYTFLVFSGQLPPGLSLSPGGVLSGMPTAAGTFVFTAKATNSGTGPGLDVASLTYALTVAPFIPFAVAVIPGAGVWRYSSNGWQQLTQAAATLAAVDARGDVAVEIAGAGVWRFEDATGWQQLTPAGVTQVAVDANGGVAVEIPGAGVWRFEDAGGWAQLTPADVTQLSAAGNGIVAVEIPGAGVWRFENATGWEQLTPADVTQLAVDARGDVAVDIPGAGVWRFEDAGGWAQLTPVDASQVSISGVGVVAVDLPSIGIWRFEDATGWEQLDALDAARLGVDSHADVLAQLTVGGLWLFQDADGWSELTPADVLFIGLGG